MLPGAMASGALVYLLVVSLVEPAAIVLTAMLPALSAFYLRSTHDATGLCGEWAAPSRGEKALRKMLPRFVLAISIYCLPSGF